MGERRQYPKVIIDYGSNWTGPACCPEMIIRWLRFQGVLCLCDKCGTKQVRPESDFVLPDDPERAKPWPQAA